jgi:hypothetical protein
LSSPDDVWIDEVYDAKDICEDCALYRVKCKLGCLETFDIEYVIQCIHLQRIQMREFWYIKRLTLIRT